MLYERIFLRFQQIDLSYAVIGGIAVNLHGYNRVTGDLDILISLTDENVSRFVTAVHELGLRPRLPVKLTDFCDAGLRSQWVQERNLKVFTVYSPTNPLEHIDVKIDKPEEVERYLSNAVIMDAEEIRIPVVCIEDLIKLKKEAGRDRDLVDVRALERIRKLNG